MVAIEVGVEEPKKEEEVPVELPSDETEGLVEEEGLLP